MKITGAILLFSLAFFCFYSDAAGERGWGFCSEYKEPPQGCTREYFPICGTDGQTYGNKCEFCGAVFEYLGSLCFAHYGECKRQDDAKSKEDL